MEQKKYPIELTNGKGTGLLLEEKYNEVSLRDSEVALRHILDSTPLKKLRLEYYPGQFSIKTGDKHCFGIDLKSFLSLALKCHTLSKYEGYEHLVQGLGNSTQFRNTEFEVESAYFCHEQNSVKNIIFGREFMVKNRSKKPEFVIETDAGQFVCECKSLGSFNRRDENTFKKVADAVSIALKPLIDVSPGKRVEVFIRESVKGNPCKNISDLAKQVSKAISLESESEHHIHEYSFIIIPSFDPKYFTDAHVCQSLCTVGPVAVNLNDHSSHQVRVLKKYSGLVKHTEGLMKDAVDQLPLDMNGIVFICATNKRASEEAVHSFVQRDSFPHIKAVILATEGWHMISKESELTIMKCALSAFG